MLKSKYIILCLMIGFINSYLAQHQITKYERQWAIKHPIAALRVKKHLSKAMIVYKNVKHEKILDEFESGGSLDAFRHCFTMAYLAQRINTKKLRKLGKAHEKGNKYLFTKNSLEFGERADSLACEMDLQNNELGFAIGTQYKTLPIDSLKQKVIEQIQQGNVWVLKRNSQKQYVSCNNEVIILENYQNQWFIPKCLIKSKE